MNQKVLVFTRKCMYLLVIWVVMTIGNTETMTNDSNVDSFVVVVNDKSNDQTPDESQLPQQKPVISLPDIPSDVYERLVANNCVSDVDFKSCQSVRDQLYHSVKIQTRQSDIIDAECCLYRRYLDCFDDRLYSAGCKKSVFDSLEPYIYDRYYNFDTKCPAYRRNSWTVVRLCPWPWYVWTLIALSINICLIATIFCLFFALTNDRNQSQALETN